MKYFVVADIHSFANELFESLKLAGYDKKNKDHKLIVIGDIFDRGNETLEVYKFLKSIPKSRRILIKGNHESLYFELLKKKFPDTWDFSNGTVRTFCHIANYLEECLNFDFYNYDLRFENRPKECWAEIIDLVKNHEITKFLQSDEWLDYYELDKFIFTHSFIPLNKAEAYAINDKTKGYSYKADWRTNTTAKGFEESRWGCPWAFYKIGLFDQEAANGKVLVCGHWHTSDFFHNLKNNFGFDGEIYYSEHLIGIDGGVSYSYYDEQYFHYQNVLVIDENFECYNEYGAKLNEVKQVPIIETVSESEFKNEKDN